ncbi:MAG: hypothetical protein GW769_15430 [Alphaproteobacteria bacterium]|nr:hypothetical protein [Alphaproteobacteria bacterium]
MTATPSHMAESSIIAVDTRPPMVGVAKPQGSPIDYLTRTIARLTKRFKK